MSSFNVTDLTNYTEKATELLQKGILYNEDWVNNYSVQTGIKYKEYLNFINVNPWVQAGACGLLASGETVFTEKEIQVVTYAYRDKFCEKDLNQKALPQGVGTFGDLAKPIEEAITMGEINAIKKQVDQDLWFGTSGMITGFIGRISGCSGAISLDTYSGVTATKDNIDDIVDDFIDNRTNAMISRGVLTIHCSVGVFNLYKRNRLYANYFRDKDATLGQMEDWVFGYEGQIKIKGEPGFGTSNYMIMTWDKNLFIGTDDVNEVASAEWIYDPLTKYVWFMSSFKLGTQIAFCDEVVHNMY
jgi:hypothetical protein